MTHSQVPAGTMTAAQHCRDSDGIVRQEAQQAGQTDLEGSTLQGVADVALKHGHDGVAALHLGFLWADGNDQLSQSSVQRGCLGDLHVHRAGQVARSRQHTHRRGSEHCAGG